jgi:hypothetical protein
MSDRKEACNVTAGKDSNDHEKIRLIYFRKHSFLRHRHGYKSCPSILMAFNAEMIVPIANGLSVSDSSIPCAR